MEIFFNHVARCVLCHTLKGQDSTVGPPLDGIAARKDASYILESLVEPSKALAQGYENLGLSPMPPMGDIFSAQELADIRAFVLTLKCPVLSSGGTLQRVSPDPPAPLGVSGYS